jgi:2-keto-3-deoxy-L-rhamnonate aldolase RhmA
VTANELSTVLRSGQRAYGTLIVSTSPKWPEAVEISGLDFVFIDTEHIPIGRETLSWMCRTYAAMGLPPIVRIPSPSPIDACQVLDGGACGIIAPYVESADQVRALVGAVKLRPLKGALAKTALQEPDRLEPQLRDYLDDFSSGNILVVNIESVPAIENLDAILSVPGLDAVLIGPHDLSVSLGIPEQYRDPAFDRAVRDIIKRARERHVAVGIHFWEGMDQEIDWAKAGANLIIHSGDISLFTSTLKKDLMEMREALGDDDQSSDTEGSILV